MKRNWHKKTVFHPRDTPSSASAIILQDDFENGLSSWDISAPPPNQATIHDFMLEDGFEDGLGAWTLTGAATTTSSNVYEGEQALLLDYHEDGTVASRGFPPTTNLRARVYFYDNGDEELGTLFTVKDSSGDFETGLGVVTDVTDTTYVIQTNSFGETYSTGVQRSTGWHLFELLVTPTGTYARIDDREIVRLNPSQTDAASVSFVASWALAGQAIYDALSIQAGYQSGKSLFLNYIDPGDPSPGDPGYDELEKAVIVSREFAPLQDVLVRTFFYDTMDPSLGTIFIVKDLSESWETGLGVAPGIGSIPPTSMNYAIRINSPAGMYDTGVQRSAGWHMFEVIVTDRGAYAKIDNRLLSSWSNPNHTSVAKIGYVSTWGRSFGLLGQALYDGFLVVAADNADWQDQLYTPLRVHYEKYSALVPPDDATVFSSLYPQLGYCYPGEYEEGKACGLHSNDLRSVMDTAIAWYVHGAKIGDTTAKALAKRVFLEGWSNAPWRRDSQDVDDWARGVCMRMVAHAAHILWDELDQETRDQVVQDLYHQAETYADRLPESGYVGNTKAEENAWHAAFLAAVVNLFPNAEGHDKEWIEAKARCFAYHAITHPSDGSYCGLDSQTVWDDWHLENHGHENPVYIASTLHLLGEAAFTYRLAGRPIPWEFTHNVQPLFWKYMTYLDRNIYHYANTPPGWGGAYDSAFISPTVFRYMDLLGVPTGISWQDYMSKRSIFYYDVSSMWLKKTPPYIRIRGWNQSDRNEDSYKFFLDSVTAGELYAMAMYSFLLLSPCEEDLYKEKAWAGVLNWTCDRSTHFAGSTSVRLSTPTDSSVEAYSPLKPVYPNHVYKISYAVKTSDLVKSLVEPATILARVVPAQYTSAAQEIDAVNAGNCVDSGLSHGVNQAGTTEWTSHSYDFATTGSTAFVRLRGVLAGMGKGRGTAWFDDIELMPLYKHTVPATSVVASSTARPTSPRNVVDGNLSTRWSAFGDGEGIRLDLGVIRDVSAVRIAFYLGDRLTVDFDIQTSLDGAVWETVFSGSSSGTTTQLEMFDVVESTARFVQVVSRRNRRNDWYSFTEIEAWGRLSSQYPSDGQIISLRSVHNSKYVAARGGENNWFLKAEGDTIGRKDKYRITVNDDGTISLKSENNGRYVVARGGVNDWFLRAEGLIIGLEGKYTCIQNRDGTVSFRSENNGLYVAACGGENDWFLRAEGRTIGLEDKYEVIVVPHRREARAN